MESAVRGDEDRGAGERRKGAASSGILYPCAYVLFLIHLHVTQYMNIYVTIDAC